MKIPLIITCLLWSSITQAQNLRDYGITKVRLNDPGKSVVMEILPAGKPKLKPDRLYYWFSGNTIHTTQGGYSGKLLNGDYNEYFPGKNLKDQGKFKKGLKDGVWKTWDESGALTQEITWSDGMKEGPFSIYDERGEVKQSGTLRQNQLNGDILFYHGKDSVETKIYKAGVPLAPVAPSPSLWQKLKRFRFTKRDSVSKAG
jgi:antitoxin component YwqK of YwqJK toxin-antitoxin module